MIRILSAPSIDTKLRSVDSPLNLVRLSFCCEHSLNSLPNGLPSRVNVWKIRHIADWTAPATVDNPALYFEHRRSVWAHHDLHLNLVRQITDRGYSVAEVSERLGVSAHSLYKWLRAIKPDNSEQHARDLLEAKSEILKLRAQLKRTEEERDILKKAAR